MAWWMAKRHERKNARPRATLDQAIYFEHDGKPCEAHEAAGPALGLPSGYGYGVHEVNPPPEGLKVCADIAGRKFYWVPRVL